MLFAPSPWRRSLTLLLLPALVLAAGAAASDQARITVRVDQPGPAISPLLYGIFFEEINRAGDGGIYAEMVQNRSFEDADFPVAWTLLERSGAEAGIALDRTRALNPQNPTSLRLEVRKPGGRAGLANDGFKGVPQRPRDRPTQPG